MSRNGCDEPLAAAHDHHAAALLDHEHAAAVAGRRGDVDRAGEGADPLQAQAGRAAWAAAGAAVAAGVAVGAAVAAAGVRAVARPPSPPQPSISTPAAATSTRTPTHPFQDDRRGAPRPPVAGAVPLPSRVLSTARGTLAELAVPVSGERARAKQPVELGRRVGGEPGVHRRRSARSCSTARSASGSARTARAPRSARPPGRRPPRARASRSCARTSRRVAVRRQRGQRPPRRARCARPRNRGGAAEQHDAGVERLAALHARDDAHDRVLEALTRGHDRPPPTQARGACEPALEVRRRRRRRRPTPAGRSARRVRRGARSGASRASASAIEPATGSSTWSRIAGNGRPATRQRVAGAVVHVQRRAVVDQPQVARASAAGSGCAACGRRSARARRATRRPRPARARAAAPASTAASPAGSPRRGCSPPLARDQLLDLRVRLGRAELRVELHEHQLGHRQPEPRAPARRPRSRRRAPSAPGRRRGT